MSTTTATPNLMAQIAALLAANGMQSTANAVAGMALPSPAASVAAGNGSAAGNGRVAVGNGVPRQAVDRTVVERTVAQPVRPPVARQIAASTGAGMVSVKGGQVVHQGRPTVGSVEEQLAAALAENARLKAARTTQRLSMKISEKGGLSVYGLGRWPVTLYKEQWIRLVEVGQAILDFIADNDSLLKNKGDE